YGRIPSRVQALTVAGSEAARSGVCAALARDLTRVACFNRMRAPGSASGAAVLCAGYGVADEVSIEVALRPETIELTCGQVELAFRLGKPLLDGRQACGQRAAIRDGRRIRCRVRHRSAPADAAALAVERDRDEPQSASEDREHDRPRADVAPGLDG